MLIGPYRKPACILAALLVVPSYSLEPQPGAAPAHPAPLPKEEHLTYTVEWRMITAGTTTLHYKPSSTHQGQVELHLESGGLISKFIKISDVYTVQMNEGFCATSARMIANEGSKHRETDVTYDGTTRKASYSEKDLTRNAVVQQKEIEIPACVQDVVSGLYRLRSFHMEPGQSVQFPMSDGKKFVQAKVEAQEREEVRLDKRSYKCMRYEAYILNDVIFRRKGHLQIWLTDDDRRLPVQIRIRLAFPVGTTTLKLEKEER